MTEKRSRLAPQLPKSPDTIPAHDSVSGRVVARTAILEGIVHIGGKEVHVCVERSGIVVADLEHALTERHARFALANAIKRTTEELNSALEQLTH